MLVFGRYITEISPPRSRGTLASIPQLLTTIGVCTGYFTCYGSVSIASSASWRIPFALQALLAFLFTFSTLLFLVESPRWLTACGRHAEAMKIWEDLGIDAAEREKIEDREAGKLPEQVKVADLFAVFAKENWKRTALGMFLMGMQQASGIDGVLYVSLLLSAYIHPIHINVSGHSMHRFFSLQQACNPQPPPSSPLESLLC
jgi:Sugar (and other) transporter